MRNTFFEIVTSAKSCFIISIKLWYESCYNWCNRNGIKEAAVPNPIYSPVQLFDGKISIKKKKQILRT